jgi:hypothetical protein
MKVHHDGFMQPQDAYLSADTGLPQADGSVGTDDVANGTANGFHMDVDSPSPEDEFNSAQG